MKSGIYEEVIYKKLKDELDKIDNTRKEIRPMDEEESYDIISRYLQGVIRNALYQSKNKVDPHGQRALDFQVELANKIVETISNNYTDTDFSMFSIDTKAQELLSVLSEKEALLNKNKKDKKILRPETSIAKSSLFTGAVSEPQMLHEIKKEIHSANRIDMLVSFVKWSGLRQMIDQLKDFTQQGGKLRVITTSYMGATDTKAIVELSKLQNTEIKISYDTKMTRLHAKTYVFYRDNEYHTAYVGSSNMSNAALTSGLEWNLKITNKDQEETMKKIEATFQSYWNAPEFKMFHEQDGKRLEEALRLERTSPDRTIFHFDLRPYSFQTEILEKLEAERNIHGHYKNLVVAATGTGKTIISAFDYQRFKKDNPRARLLFIAHRKEILEQSLMTYRAVLKDPNFGELHVGEHKFSTDEHLFMSIQGLNTLDYLDVIEEDYYDFVVIDEFHHAAAKSYQKLLSRIKPKVLLGLTATPERMDGKNVLEYFDGRIAAEIRLPEAIERKLLVPFHYFGVTDSVDLDTLKWSRGGYDKSELSNIYTFDEVVANKRASLIYNSLLHYTTSIEDLKALGFCVSVEHAQFMADAFNHLGIPSVCLHGKSSFEERKNGPLKLRNGEIKIIFVVDLYNEGVDIPEVNTVLFLRPTESLTVFLQQFGRGLRIHENKECLTVLDFIGAAHKKYRFEEKFKALFLDRSKSVTEEIKKGFIHLPKGCFIELERIASKHVLDNIRSNLNTKNQYLINASSFQEDTGLELNLRNFLDYYHLDVREFYKRVTLTEMRYEDVNQDLLKYMQKGFNKVTLMDSRGWIRFILEFLNDKNKKLESLSQRERTLVQMFYVNFFGDKGITCDDDLNEGIKRVRNSGAFFEELIELLEYQYDQIDFIDKPMKHIKDVPLDIHCRYSRDHILIAMGILNPSSVREGVKWVPDKNTDLLFVTLNKSDKDYSPTTMYDDYSINERLFHWQSQSTTSDTSEVGKRYINHRKGGSHVLLFVRDHRKDQVNKSLTDHYTFLGFANYVSHEGSKPMNIIWSLEEPIPAKFIKKSNKLAAI